MSRSLRTNRAATIFFLPEARVIGLVLHCSHCSGRRTLSMMITLSRPLPSNDAELRGRTTDG